MKDQSILVVKPEIIERHHEVKLSLERRGYFSLVNEIRNGWIEVMRQIYCPQFSSKHITSLICAYNERWSDEYGLFLLSHNNGNTLAELNKDEGNFKDYQTQMHWSLRLEFGLPARYNIPVDDKFTIVFNGLHCPKTKDDLERHLKIFNLS
ncbi:hypothetical protein HYW75_04825 [Candidatus Pacearchaeota archaeon]|nr:hypothetical protein [Candidatus Pacearchaeota archaeon]